MPRYIDAELLDAETFENCTAYQAQEIIDDQPTADVVPRAEVETAIHKFAERLQTYYKTLKGDTLSSMVAYQIEQIESDILKE